MLFLHLWVWLLFKHSYSWPDGKKKEAAHFWNSLMIPIWKVLQAAQATEIKCKRPLRLEVCRLGIITLCTFEKGKAVSAPGGRESKHRPVLWETDARAHRCQSRPRGHRGLQIKFRPARQPGRMKGKSGRRLPAQKGGIAVPLRTFLAEQHLAPHIVLPPPH